MQSTWGWAFLDLGLLSTLPHGTLIPVKPVPLGFTQHKTSDRGAGFT